MIDNSVISPTSFNFNGISWEAIRKQRFGCVDWGKSFETLRATRQIIYRNDFVAIPETLIETEVYLSKLEELNHAIKKLQPTDETQEISRNLTELVNQTRNVYGIMSLPYFGIRLSPDTQESRDVLKRICKNHYEELLKLQTPINQAKLRNANSFNSQLLDRLDEHYNGVHEIDIETYARYLESVLSNSLTARQRTFDSVKDKKGLIGGLGLTLNTDEKMIAVATVLNEKYSKPVVIVSRDNDMVNMNQGFIESEISFRGLSAVTKVGITHNTSLNKVHYPNTLRIPEWVPYS